MFQNEDCFHCFLCVKGINCQPMTPQPSSVRQTHLAKKERRNDVGKRDVSRLGEKHVYSPRNSRAEENTCNGENASRDDLLDQVLPVSEDGVKWHN